MAKHLPILIAEDEETDALIIQMAASRAGIHHPLVLVKDGSEAVAYLQGEAPYNDRSKHPVPALLLLDLKMPRRNGFEVLEWLSTRRELSSLPAVVLSSSPQESDITRALQLGAVEYHVKPLTTAELADILTGLAMRWLSSPVWVGSER